MANRFWVGGTGTWDGSTTTHWSTTSGGAGGASAPTTADSVIFDAASNTGTSAFTVTTSGTPACLDFTTGGAGGALDGVMTLTMGAALTIAGNLTLPATNFATSGTPALTLTATSGTKTVTTNGVTLTAGVTFNGVGGTWQLQDNLTTTDNATLSNGTLDLNAHTLKAKAFFNSGTGTRVIVFGSSGVIQLSGSNTTVWSAATVTNFSWTGTPNIQLTYAGSVGTRTLTVGSTAGANEAFALPFQIQGGTDSFQITASSSVGSLNFTGFAGSITTAASLTVYGDVTFGSGMSIASGETMTFAKTSGTQTLTTNGVVRNGALVKNGAGGTLALAGNVSILNAALTLTNGTLDLAGFTFTVGTLATGSGTKNLTFNGGTLVVTATSVTAFNNANPTNFTTTAGSGNGVISMTSASAKTFVGGGSDYKAALNQGGAGALTITGANTFTDLTNTTQPATISFTAGTTNTFGAFSLAGTAGNLITLGSVTAATHTLSKASGTVNVSFLTISHSTATGGATWDALTGNGNVDGGSNSGWIFTGATYNVSQDETTSATDTVAQNATLPSTVTEAAAGVDTVSDVATDPNIVTEAANAVDATDSISTFDLTVAEAANAADTTNGQAIFVNAIVEVANAQDTEDAPVAGVDAVQEAASAADTTGVIGTLNLSVAESAPILDTTSAGTVFANSVIAEMAAAADTTSARHFRPTWFLSFAQVDPHPPGEGPGNTGKLFGDIRLEEVT